MRWSPLPVAHVLRSRLSRAAPLRWLRARALSEVAQRSWELAPGSEQVIPPAYFLPGQLERVTDWVFADEHPGRKMSGNSSVTHGPTRAHLLEDVWLIDGVLYKGPACSHLSPRESRLPRLHVRTEIEQGAIYCSAAGNRWFGMWLMDDCPLYPLACESGRPITTQGPPKGHARDYEAWLDMKPTRVRNALLRRLVVFEDVGHNRDKHRRFRALNDKLRARVDVEPHAGVFLLRGRAGDPRVLQDERALADRLAKHRGLTVIDPLRVDVPTLVRTCAGARVVVGVEGSQLAHALMALPRGASLVTLQPPGRFCGLLKDLTDRDGQHFGFVVGRPAGEDFVVDPSEVERTLDLMPT